MNFQLQASEIFFMLKRHVVRNTTWVCNSCASRVLTLIRSYAHARKSGGSSLGSRRANQSLSKNVGKSKINSAYKTAPKNKPFAGSNNNNRALTFTRSYTYANKSGGSSLGSRRANQSLSRNVGRSKFNSAYKAAPKNKPFARSNDEQLPVLQRAPRITPRGKSNPYTSTLSSVARHLRDAAKKLTKTNDGFGSLCLLPNVRDAIQTTVLRKLGHVSPTPIQALSIRAILQAMKNELRHTFLIAAETGSGKTLAYLAPIINKLKFEEQYSLLERQIARPRCIILLPSKELVYQVGLVVKSIARRAMLSSTFLMPAYGFRRAKNQVLKRPVDILVTMPFQLVKLLDEGILLLDKTKHLVIDEADTLLDTSFADTVEPIISRSSEYLQSLIFCSATIPRSMDASLREKYPEAERLVSPKIHSIPRRIATKFVDVQKEYNGSKNKATHQILRDLYNDQTEPGKTKKVIIFVNKRETVPEVIEFLTSREIPALPFSKGGAWRDENISHFLDRPKMKASSGRMKVLVTTDLASRGIDTTTVKNVIIYDTPYSTVDLLHRIGRTGRAGRRGTAYILVTDKRGETWIKDVKQLSIDGSPLT